TETEAARRFANLSLDDIPAVQLLLRGDVAADLTRSARMALCEVTAARRDSDYLDRKDSFYFHQRLQHYLNRSTYYKLTVLEVQNPWLDRAILEFIATIPRPLRLDKRLYKLAVTAMYPDLSGIPFAQRHSLEN